MRHAWTHLWIDFTGCTSCEFCSFVVLLLTKLLCPPPRCSSFVSESLLLKTVQLKMDPFQQNGTATKNNGFFQVFCFFLWWGSSEKQHTLHFCVSYTKKTHQEWSFAVCESIKLWWNKSDCNSAIFADFCWLLVVIIAISSSHHPSFLLEMVSGHHTTTYSVSERSISLSVCLFFFVVVGPPTRLEAWRRKKKFGEYWAAVIKDFDALTCWAVRKYDVLALNSLHSDLWCLYSVCAKSSQDFLILFLTTFSLLCLFFQPHMLCCLPILLLTFVVASVF